MPRRPLAMLATILAIAGAAPAHAADEEIQVYLNEINAPHQPGLELHVNDVASGDHTLDYPGQEQSIGRLRVTPEWSLGLDDHFELGAYLPLTTLDSSGHLRVDGWKLRLKWLGSHAERGWFYGANYEVGRTSYRLDRNPWNNEIKLIGGYEAEHWIAGANINVDFALSGPARPPASVELASKFGYKLTETTTIGVESYNGAGTVSVPARFGQSPQSSFVALDTRLGKWDFNLGVGHGYGTNRDGTIIKLIVGIPLGK